ncbi:MAG TPA: DUF2510 domain-containing protein [Solirubrobacteraceae bacterium]|nr:DUF2510 domain-containing protein [Solirubrobacteraceae bacterium]
MTDHPAKVVKGDLDSVIHGKGEGPFGDSIWMLVLLGSAKILLVASLVGIYYLFRWFPLAAVLALLVVCGLVMWYNTSPKIAVRRASKVARHRSEEEARQKAQLRKEEEWLKRATEEIRQISPLPMGTPAGWYYDPVGAHNGRKRYWDGGQWSAYCSVGFGQLERTFIYGLRDPSKAAVAVVASANQHLLRAERYEREGNTAMAEHTRRMYNLPPQIAATQPDSFRT